MAVCSIAARCSSSNRSAWAAAWHVQRQANRASPGGAGERRAASASPVLLNATLALARCTVAVWVEANALLRWAMRHLSGDPKASTNLANPVWTPLASNTLTSGSAYFSDPQRTNYPSRFYRLRWP